MPRLPALPVSSSRLFVSNRDKVAGTATTASYSKDSDNRDTLFASPPPNSTMKNKEKRNKYAKFSKVETNESALDPLEALIRESEAKLLLLEQEMEAKKKGRHGRKYGQETTNVNIPLSLSIPADTTRRLNFPNNKHIDPYDPTTFGFVEIGTILGPHGVHGWVKVEGCTDFPERLTTRGMILHLKPFRKRAPRMVILSDGKWTGHDSFLIQLEDNTDRKQAEKLKGGTLYYATQQDNVKKEDDLLLSDLVGLQVMLLTDEEKEEEGGTNELVVGVVGGIVLADELCSVPGLGQDMLEIMVERRKSDIVSPGTPKELVLIPMVPEIVTKVDLKEQRIWIDPPAGLLDLTYIRETTVRIKGLLPPAKN